MAEISAQIVKELREKTGAGMMDCKKALQASEGDMTKAIEYLRQKGLASAGKKAGRVAAEGLVDSYIHTGGRIGVLVEVNCETDFVARNDDFKTLVQNIAKQIAACPNVEYIQVSDVPAEIGERERAIALGSDALKGKPENVKEKIVQGKVDKTLREMCLLDQPFIRDQSISVEDLIKQAIAKLGENIQVRRFSRFVLGEGIEKAEANLADEVAQVTGQAPAPAPAPTAEPTPAATAPVESEAAPEPAPVAAGSMTVNLSLEISQGGAKVVEVSVQPADAATELPGPIKATVTLEVPQMAEVEAPAAPPEAAVEASAPESVETPAEATVETPAPEEEQPQAEPAPEAAAPEAAAPEAAPEADEATEKAEQAKQGSGFGQTNKAKKSGKGKSGR